MPLSPPQFIENQIARDLEEPGGELRPRHVAFRAFPDSDEDLLRDVFDIRVVAQHPRDRSRHQRPVPLDQALQRGRLPRAHRLHQLHVLPISLGARERGILAGHRRLRRAEVRQYLNVLRVESPNAHDTPSAVFLLQGWGASAS